MNADGRWRWIFLWSLGLIALTAIAFWPVVHCSFINFDDDGYVTANPAVQHGLTWQGICWAFSSTPLNLWHPLSFVSFMIDYELFGLDPAGYHIVNAVIHGINVVILFLLLNSMTACTWRSGLLAALFAVHPLRVESVAWVAERKDVLAMLFGLLAIAAYVRYTRKPKVGRYVLVCLLATLSILSKPLFLTLPVLLLLLDYWPLNRLVRSSPNSNLKCGIWNLKSEISNPKSGFPYLDKLPLLLLTAILFAIIQWFAAAQPGRQSDAYRQQTGERLGNAVVSCVRYLTKQVDFSALALPYPFTGAWPAAYVWGSLMLLGTVSAGAWHLRKGCPWLLFGWLWFLVALIPVLGLQGQIGFHAMADRYSYIPSIGLLAMLIWSLPERWVMQRKWLTAPAGMATVAILVFFTWTQLGYWRNSITLFQHTIAVTSNNDFAEYSLGCAYWTDSQDAANAITHLEAALKIRPDLASAHDNLGTIFMQVGRFADALDHFRLAALHDPESFEVQNNWACALSRTGDNAAAIEHLKKAVAMHPAYLEARVNLGELFMRTKQPSLAIEQFEYALTLAPGHPQVERSLALARSAAGL